MQRELARMQGEWRAIAGERDGQLRPRAFLEALRVRVEGEVLILELGQRRQRLRMILHPELRPKAIELVHLDGKEQGEVWQGIYALQEQRWRLCLSPPNVPRPDDFLTRPGTGRELLLLEKK
ncbi:hypothetical protein HRbin36_02456 [bacterium HR36]|nr:hypothetical protein HRbin36_02456 [bacterium HR36]